MPKRIVLIHPDGTETILPEVPTLKEMQHLVGGYIEYVTVLDRYEGGQRIYTSIYVNETGLIDNLPRNDKATKIYQRNVRATYAAYSDPFAAAEARWRGGLDPAMTVIDARTDIPGYNSDPWIAGPAIYFEGWTREEVDAALDAVTQE